MPRKAKPLPLPLVDPASHPPPGFRAMLIRRTKMKYPEMSESQIARYVGCSPSNVHQVLKSFLACRPIRIASFDSDCRFALQTCLSYRIRQLIAPYKNCAVSRQ